MKKYLTVFALSVLTLATRGVCGQKNVAGSEQVPAAVTETIADTIPPDGTYRFDIAFAEWEGKSMGEKVTVVISDDSIRVIYEGDGHIGEKGIMDDGKIMKHKSGVWIIGHDPADTQLDEVGGCTGGPSVIDFKNKKYEIC